MAENQVAESTVEGRFTQRKNIEEVESKTRRLRRPGRRCERLIGRAQVGLRRRLLLRRPEAAGRVGGTLSRRSRIPYIRGFVAGGSRHRAAQRAAGAAQGRAF